MVALQDQIEALEEWKEDAEAAAAEEERIAQEEAEARLEEET